MLNVELGAGMQGSCSCLQPASGRGTLQDLHGVWASPFRVAPKTFSSLSKIPLNCQKAFNKFPFCLN